MELLNGVSGVVVAKAGFWSGSCQFPRASCTPTTRRPKLNMVIVCDYRGNTPLDFRATLFFEAGLTDNCYELKKANCR